jgi:hypothetical protein
MIVLGVAGYARCGKDTYVSIAKKILTANGYIPIRIAFADALKDEVATMLRKNYFKTDVFTTDTADKTLLRPLLVWWGCQRRRESKGGLYWVHRAAADIKATVSSYDANIPSKINKLVFLISDVRFPNEAKWVKDVFDGEVIHLKRYSTHKSESPIYIDGKSRNDQTYIVFDPAPNEEELIQDPLVYEMADQKISWENRGNLKPEQTIIEPYLVETVFNSLTKSKFFSEIVLK